MRHVTNFWLWDYATPEEKKTAHPIYGKPIWDFPLWMSFGFFQGSVSSMTSAAQSGSTFLSTSKACESS
eukprot:5889813-Amphidinium_carterae.1